MPEPVTNSKMPRREYTTEEDKAAGWTDSDWMSGWGGVDQGERWRFQLNRRLYPSESNAFVQRVEETYDPDLPGYDLLRTLSLMHEVVDPDVKLVRCRLGSVEATEIKDGWNPVFPDQEEIA